MIVNAAAIQAVFQNLKSTFSKAFDQAVVQWERTAMRVPSGGSEELYAWFANFPQMRKWIGEKVIKSLAAHGYTVVNDDYESTIQVLRNHIEDDKLGIYAPQAQMAGWAARNWPDAMVAALKNGAFTGLCYDGQYFYDTDHPVGGGVKSNKGTAALSVANLAGAEGSYGAARTAIMTMTDDDGAPLGLVPDLLEVPPALEAKAKILVERDELADQSPNPFRGTAQVLVNPRLTSATAWFLHVTSMPVKPFVFQERKAPVFVNQLTEASDDVFKRGAYNFGVEARGAAGYGLWQLSYGSTGAG
jgi:phage major head subunit gpT-like protein